MVTARNKDLIEFDDNEYDEEGDLVDIKKAKPAKMISKEVAQKQSKLTNFRKKAAMANEHILEPNDAWKKQLALWPAADEDTRRNYLYGLIFHDGAIRLDLQFICKFFGIKRKELDPYKEVIDAAEAALALKLQKNSILFGLIREDQVDMKYHLLKQYAQQVQNPTHEGEVDVDQTGVTFTVDVKKKERSIEEFIPNFKKPELKLAANGGTTNNG